MQKASTMTSVHLEATLLHAVACTKQDAAEKQMAHMNTGRRAGFGYDNEARQASGHSRDNLQANELSCVWSTSGSDLSLESKNTGE